MVDGLAIGVSCCALLVGLVCLFYVWRDRPVGVGAAVAAGVVELVLLAQAVVAVVLIVGGERPDEGVSFVLYLIGSLVAVPAGVWWARGEPSRWGAGVLAVVFLALPVVVVRMQHLWEATGATGG
jgi:hypothetical protein